MAKTTYANLPINHSEVPIRLFKSDFLEFFTHIHPAVVLLLYVPVVLGLLGSAIMPRVAASESIAPVVLAYVMGLGVWTLTEYLLHRFVFHYEPTWPWLQRVWYLIHGVHHEQPQCKTRLVMPPILSIPLAFLFYSLFRGVVGGFLGLPQWTGSTFAGFLTGYLMYDMLHYAEHHLSMKWGFLKFIKIYHLKHHYKNPNNGFGVSSPLWDYVFRTRPKDS